MGLHHRVSSEGSLTGTASSQQGEQPHLLIAGWSAPSVALTCRLTLPSLLATGNLGNLDRSHGKVPATILCLGGDRAQYEASVTFNAFADARSIFWFDLEAYVELLGEAREAVASAGFRSVMASLQNAGTARSYLLVKAGHVFADGALARVAGLLAEGALAVMAPVPMVDVGTLLHQVPGDVLTNASGLQPRAMARAAIADGVSAASSLHERAGMLGFAPRRGQETEETSNRTLWVARLHPIGLRPEHSIDPARESLLDAEIVPEIGLAERRVHRASSSDEILILEARSPRALLGDVTAPQPDLIVEQIAAWATPWHLSNLAVPYELVVDAMHSEPEPTIPQVPPGPGVPALHHPAWLAARKLRRVPYAVGEDRRYMSALDGHYRAARLAIEATTAQSALYAGPAETIFAPLLRRRFRHAMIGDTLQVLRAAQLRSEVRSDRLYVLHIEWHDSPPLFCALEDAMGALSTAGCPILLLVEAYDAAGGLPAASLEDLRDWYDSICAVADGAGAVASLGATTFAFFEGHPGFLISIVPREGVAAPPVEAAAVQTGVAAWSPPKSGTRQIS